MVIINVNNILQKSAFHKTDSGKMGTNRFLRNFSSGQSIQICGRDYSQEVKAVDIYPLKAKDF
jgi:ribosomal protein L21E